MLTNSLQSLNLIAQRTQSSDHPQQLLTVDLLRVVLGLACFWAIFNLLFFPSSKSISSCRHSSLQISMSPPNPNTSATLAPRLTSKNLLTHLLPNNNKSMLLPTSPGPHLWFPWKPWPPTTCTSLPIISWLRLQLHTSPAICSNLRNYRLPLHYFTDLVVIKDLCKLTSLVARLPTGQQSPSSPWFTVSFGCLIVLHIASNLLIVVRTTIGH